MYKRVLQNKSRLKLQRVQPRHQLLRLREVQDWLGVCRDYVELLEKEGRVTPFRKTKRAKAWYRAYELSFDFELPPPRGEWPRTKLIRRAQALDWLGVPAAEFASWVRYGIISARHVWPGRSKAFYSVREIECNVLGIPGSR